MTDNSHLIIDALVKTNPTLAASIDASNSFRDAVKLKGARVRKYRRYERGDHDANITEQMRNMLRLKTDDAGLVDFNDNYTRIVIDKMAGRLEVDNIDGGNDTVNAWIGEHLDRNDWEALQGESFRGAIREGDSYIIIDPQTLYWSSEPAYDGFSGVVAIFDNITHRPLWACKLWSEADYETQLVDDEAAPSSGTANMQIVVYQPGEITFWRGEEGGTVVVSGNNEAIPWPLGKIPLVHFANQRDSYTDYGESEIRPAIPLQDVLNRTLYSMVMASELSAFKLYWAIGIAISKSDIVPGAVINMVLNSTELTAEQIEFLKAVRVGEFGGTDLSQYTNQIDKIVREISQATQTPIYGVTAQGNISGEALKQLETGLIGKIKRFQRENTGAVRELISLTAEMQNSFNNILGKSAPKVGTVSANWQSPEILDANARIATLTKMRSDSPGLWPDEWYRVQIGGLLGMSQADIRKQGELAQLMQTASFEALTGGGGMVPVA